jgi:hypothetical protein
MLTGHKLVVQRHVERYVAMQPIERAHADLSTKLLEIEDGSKTNLHDGILYYQVHLLFDHSSSLVLLQIRNELSQKRRNDELAQLTAAKVDPISSISPVRHMRSMSSLSLRQEAYRRKRTTSNIEPVKTTEDESEDDQSAAMHSLNSLSEIKVSSLPLSESPTKLSRMSRAMNASLIGHHYPEEVMDKAKMSDDTFGQSFCMSLKDQSAEGKKRHAQDLLMLREMRAGILPEQLLKRIPRMGNLISIDLSHYGIGDELGKCLGTRYCSSSSFVFVYSSLSVFLSISPLLFSICTLDMLHTLGLRGNRLTEKSMKVILGNISNRSLRHLDLSDNDLRGEGIRHLCQILSNPSNKVSSLELSKTHLSSGDIKLLCEAFLAHETSWILDLSLSHNNLDSKAMEYLAKFFSFSGCSLNWCDLSWNSFDALSGELLAGALSINKTLSSINLSANCLRDEGGQHIAACLLGNQTLREIYLSLNNIGGKTCFIFSKVLRVHPNMERLDLSDNPLTEAGARSMFRTILRGLRCFVMMQNCTFTGEVGLFNHSNPSLDSPYDLDLSQPYQVAILSELISMVNLNTNCSFKSLVYKQSDKDDRKEINITAQCKNNETYLRHGSTPWTIPNYGILKVHFSHQVTIPTESMAIDDLAFNTILAIVINAKSENDRKNWLMLMAMDAYFLSTQAQDLIDILEDRRLIGSGGISKVDLFLSLWSNIIDTINLYDFMYDNLDTEERLHLQHSLTLEKFKFNWINPTGHWRLDLSIRIQRNVFMQIIAHNAVESKNSELKSKRNDTSQKGNWYNFRNERLNNTEITIDIEFTKNIPWNGFLEFDYVTTTRPLVASPNTISDTDFELLAKKLDISSRRRLTKAQGNIKLLELQLAITKYYFSCSDVLNIMDCFHDEDVTQARVVIIMFNRIDDLFNFDVILRHLSGVAVQDVFHRLGVLNCLNPLKPSHDYKLNMRYVDNRIMTHNLLQLSSLENGDQLKQHPKSQVDIIALYAALGRLVQEQMNSTLQFSYCEIGERQSVPAWNFRKDLLKHFLLGTQPMDSRMFKIITIYKEIEIAGMLLVGPLDLQYREFMKTKNMKKKKGTLGGGGGGGGGGTGGVESLQIGGGTLSGSVSVNSQENTGQLQHDEESIDSSYNSSSVSTVPSLPNIYQYNAPQSLMSGNSSNRTSPSASARKLEDVVDINPLLEADYGNRRRSTVL